MAHVPDMTLRMTHGAVMHGEWCEVHLLPHQSRTRVYAVTPTGVTLTMGEATWCDEDGS